MNNSTFQPVSLREIGYFYGGLTGKSGKDFGRGNSKYITFMNVIKNVIAESDLTEFVEIKDGERQNKVSKGDLLFNGSSETPEEVAFPSLVTSDLEGLYLNSFCFGFRFEKLDIIDPLFFAYYLRSNYGRQFMSQLAQGSTRYNISKRALLDVEWRLPNVKEQKAIAEALSDIDELISISKIERRKLEHLMAGKLTHLFSPHFQTNYHFEDTTIDELSFVIKGSARKYSNTYSPSTYPYVNGGINPSGYTDSFNCESGTVLVSEGGNSCGFVNFYKERVWSGGHSYRVKAKNDSIRAEYLYYLLKFNESRIMGLRVGSGLPNVQAKDLKALSLKHCKEFTYQEMVIQELDDITSLIENSSKIVQEYEWLKQGMMNDLLTGKVRLV